jgi:NitT/TauT family transport system permease protein
MWHSTKRFDAVRNITAAVAAVVSMVVVWSLSWKLSGTQFFPPPFSVLTVATSLLVSGEFIKHFLATVGRIILGFSLSSVFTLFIVGAMNKNDWLRRFFTIQVTVGLTIPSLAWSVIGVMLFGLHDAAAVFTVIAATTPAMITSLDQGVRAIDGDLLEMGTIFGLSKRSMFFSVIIPQLFPHMFGAARYGISLAWKTVIITEMLGLGTGIGYQISYYFGLLSLKHVLAWTLVFTITMLLLEYGIIQRLEVWLFRWRPRNAAQ